MSREPKYQQLANAIRGQIQRGELQPGDPLPSTPKLRARYHVGNDVVRYAMSVLEQDGVIVTRGGVGRWVFPGPPDPLHGDTVG